MSDERTPGVRLLRRALAQASDHPEFPEPVARVRRRVERHRRRQRAGLAAGGLATVLAAAVVAQAGVFAGGHPHPAAPRPDHPALTVVDPPVEALPGSTVTVTATVRDAVTVGLVVDQPSADGSVDERILDMRHVSGSTWRGTFRLSPVSAADVDYRVIATTRDGAHRTTNSATYTVHVRLAGPAITVRRGAAHRRVLVSTGWGSGPGQLNPSAEQGPVGLLADAPRGRLYLLDPGNRRMAAYGLDGTPLRALSGTLPWAHDAAVDDATGDLYLADAEAGRLLRISGGRVVDRYDVDLDGLAGDPLVAHAGTVACASGNRWHTVLDARKPVAPRSVRVVPPSPEHPAAYAAGDEVTLATGPGRLYGFAFADPVDLVQVQAAGADVWWLRVGIATPHRGEEVWLVRATPTDAVATRVDWPPTVMMSGLAVTPDAAYLLEGAPSGAATVVEYRFGG